MFFDRLVARWTGAVSDRPVATVPRVVSRIEYDRQPQAAWQAALDAQHIPGTARVIVAWEAGDLWQPINRWMLWQLQPWPHVDDTFRKELRGPHPRTNARLEYVPAIIDGRREMRPRIHGGPCRLIDRRTWELHREIERTTGELTRPRRLWVIQGSSGGHPFMVSPTEEKLRRAQGVSPDVPSAGDLPYAEFDPRVLRALERYDLWRYAHGLGDPMTHGAALTIARMTDTEREAHTLMWGQLNALSEEWADGAAHAARQDGLHRLRFTKVGEKARVVDYDREREEYINDFTIEAA